MSGFKPRKRSTKRYRVVQSNDVGRRSRTFSSAKSALAEVRYLQQLGRPTDAAGRLHNVYVSDVSPEREGYDELLADAGEKETGDDVAS